MERVVGFAVCKTLLGCREEEAAGDEWMQDAGEAAEMIQAG